MMRISLRTFRPAVIALIAASATLLPTSSALAASPTPTVPPGATVGTLEGLFLYPGYASNQFGRKLCAAPNKCQHILYNNTGSSSSIADGVAKLDKWLRTTPGPKIVHGYSLGASVASAWLRTYGTDPNTALIPDVRFILVGNPERAVTGNHVSKPGYGGISPAVRYGVTDVCRKWDSVCYKIPGDIRSSLGFGLHLDYTRVDLNSPANVVTTSGNITSVLVPTAGWG